MSEELHTKLEKQTAITEEIRQQVVAAEMANELEKQKQEQEAWQAMLDKLNQGKQVQREKHTKKLADLLAVDTTTEDNANPQLE